MDPRSVDDRVEVLLRLGWADDLWEEAPHGCQRVVSLGDKPHPDQDVALSIQEGTERVDYIECSTGAALMFQIDDGLLLTPQEVRDIFSIIITADEERETRKRYVAEPQQWTAALDRLPYTGQGRGDMLVCTHSLVDAGIIEDTPNAPIYANAYAKAHQPDVTKGCRHGCPLRAKGLCQLSN